MSTTNFTHFHQSLIDRFGSTRVKTNELLSKHTYMKVGGPADLLIEVKNKSELFDAISISTKNQHPYFVLGSGSNIIVSDQGVRGLVIKNRADKITLLNKKGGIKNQSQSIQSVIVEVESGTITNHLVRYTIDHNLEGLEYFLGLPGTIGGAIYNNSHYKDQLIGNFILEVEVLDKLGQHKSYSKDQMDFAYDYSILHQTKEIILSAKFSLNTNHSGQLWDQAKAYAKTRASSQPLSQPSSGCIFKNPSFQQVSDVGLDKTMAIAGLLIDKTGLKGLSVGGAQVSDKHANFIVNTGSATTVDIKKLIKIIQHKVKEKYNIKLEPEVFFVGE